MTFSKRASDHLQPWGIDSKPAHGSLPRAPLIKEKITVRQLINRGYITSGHATHNWASHLRVTASTIRRWKQRNAIPHAYWALILTRLGINVANFDFTPVQQAAPAQSKQAGLKRFLLVRNNDVSGVSGTGVVAEGVQFANGVCALNWLTKFTSQGIYPNLKEVVGIHGHDGATTVKFID
jgi:hypothetical protein